MRSGKFSPFGLCVKKKLLDEQMSQDELIRAVHEKTGLFVDGGYMYKILTGQRNPEKIITAICEVLGLSDKDYSST